MDYCSILLLPYSISSGALGSPDLLPAYFMITLALHDTIILIITLTEIFLYSTPKSLITKSININTGTWNPIEKQLASGSADGVCRLWGLNDITQESWNNATDSNIAIRSAILSHTAFVGEKFKDVTSVTWSPDGQSLST